MLLSTKSVPLLSNLKSPLHTGFKVVLGLDPIIVTLQAGADEYSALC